MNPFDPLQLFTVTDVAKLMRKSEAWVRQQYKTGRLDYLKDGRSIRFRRSAVEALQNSHDPHAAPVHLAAVIELNRAA